MGKVFGKVLQRRLYDQVLTEEVLSDSQCGFHSGRAGADPEWGSDYKGGSLKQGV